MCDHSASPPCITPSPDAHATPTLEVKPRHDGALVEVVGGGGKQPRGDAATLPGRTSSSDVLLAHTPDAPSPRYARVQLGVSEQVSMATPTDEAQLGPNAGSSPTSSTVMVQPAPSSSSSSSSSSPPPLSHQPPRRRSQRQLDAIAQAEKDAQEACRTPSSSVSSDSDDESIELPLTRNQSMYIALIRRQRRLGLSASEILQELGLQVDRDDGDEAGEGNPDEKELWDFLVELASYDNPFEALQELIPMQPREKLPHINTIGVSTSCGIPDFRSENGLYDIISKDDTYEFKDAQALFSIDQLLQDPRPFFRFAKALYPGNYVPSATHYFILELERRAKLLRNYTQNIDTLEAEAGIEKVVTCHGSFQTATCLNCRDTVPCSAIRETVIAGQIPWCETCKGPNSKAKSFYKPNIIFFGEQLDSSFRKHLEADCKKVDLLIVIGSSLKVRPVAMVPVLVDDSVPQILINREVAGEPHEFDVHLAGNCDDVVYDLCQRLGWMLPIPAQHVDELERRRLTHQNPLGAEHASGSASGSATSCHVEEGEADVRPLKEDAPPTTIIPTTTVSDVGACADRRRQRCTSPTPGESLITSPNPSTTTTTTNTPGLDVKRSRDAPESSCDPTTSSSHAQKKTRGVDETGGS